MKFQQIGALFCSVLIIAGCAASTSHEFFINRYSLDTKEFDRGYEAGTAFAKTEGHFNSSPKDVPSAMQKIIETESDSYQKGFLAGYRDRKVRNGRVFGATFWGSYTILMTGLIVADILSEEE
ncbi:hypothetical protein F4X33_06300 [Candidatus Poribacteria bacterium]|nr:hypothetical protein [Candidatus Poribacteria bacterium]